MSNTVDLWRDSNGSNPAYPFDIGPGGSLGTITGANTTNPTSFYYFFFDWEVFDAKACPSDRSEAVVQVSVGIDELSGKTIELWPNPTNGQLNIVLGEVQDQLQLELFDVLGRSVLAKSVGTSDVINGNLVLDLSGFAKGDYLLKLSNAQESISERVILQ